MGNNLATGGRAFDLLADVFGIVETSGSSQEKVSGTTSPTPPPAEGTLTSLPGTMEAPATQAWNEKCTWLPQGDEDQIAWIKRASAHVAGLKQAAGGDGVADDEAKNLSSDAVELQSLLDGVLERGQSAFESLRRLYDFGQSLVGDASVCLDTHSNNVTLMSGKEGTNITMPLPTLETYGHLQVPELVLEAWIRGNLRGSPGSLRNVLTMGGERVISRVTQAITDGALPLNLDTASAIPDASRADPRVRASMWAEAARTPDRAFGYIKLMGHIFGEQEVDAACGLMEANPKIEGELLDKLLHGSEGSNPKVQNRLLNWILRYLPQEVRIREDIFKALEPIRDPDSALRLIRAVGQLPKLTSDSCNLVTKIDCLDPRVVNSLLDFPSDRRLAWHLEYLISRLPKDKRTTGLRRRLAAKCVDNPSTTEYFLPWLSMEDPIQKLAIRYVALKLSCECIGRNRLDRRAEGVNRDVRSALDHGTTDPLDWLLEKRFKPHYRFATEQQPRQRRKPSHWSREIREKIAEAWKLRKEMRRLKDPDPLILKVAHEYGLKIRFDPASGKGWYCTYPWIIRKTPWLRTKETSLAAEIVDRALRGTGMGGVSAVRFKDTDLIRGFRRACAAAIGGVGCSAEERQTNMKELEIEGRRKLKGLCVLIRGLRDLQLEQERQATQAMRDAGRPDFKITIDDGNMALRQAAPIANFRVREVIADGNSQKALQILTRLRDDGSLQTPDGLATVKPDLGERFGELLTLLNRQSPENRQVILDSCIATLKVASDLESNPEKLAIFPLSDAEPEADSNQGGTQHTAISAK